MKYNYYIGEYRAVMISGKWRITKINPKDSREYLFLNNIEYDNPSEAFQDIDL